MITNHYLALFKKKNEYLDKLKKYYIFYVKIDVCLGTPALIKPLADSSLFLLQKIILGGKNGKIQNDN